MDRGEQQNWIKLNVAGTHFMVSRTTLARLPDSFLYKLCIEDSGFTGGKDETGAFLIDRNPKYFDTILDFYRHGQLFMDKNLSEDGVLEEAKFFNLPGLCELVEQKKRHKKKRHMKKLMSPDRVKYKAIKVYLNMDPPTIIKDIPDGWIIDKVLQNAYNTILILSQKVTDDSDSDDS
uniref:BTB/POZ domain-containing protein KCTD5 n=1 Tax=Lygus hesperus TaxID=30085 RepID=A0A146MHX7_LYGHE